MPDVSQHSERPTDTQRAAVRSSLPDGLNPTDDEIDDAWRRQMVHLPHHVAYSFVIAAISR